eukprot:Mrub_02054.p1 GENE.Mrub_02054~~Mrub_02054.p1  ORF type:complete len:596 (+),score=141.58 Mrub_02054:101-1789(+)
MIERLKNPDNKLFHDIYLYLLSTLDPLTYTKSHFDRYEDFLEFMEFVNENIELEKSLKFKSYSRKNFLSIGSNWKYAVDILEAIINKINEEREARNIANERVKELYGGVEDYMHVHNKYVQMYCDIFSNNDIENEYEEFNDKLNQLNNELFKKTKTQINTYKENIIKLENQKRQLLEKLKEPTNQNLKLKNLNTNLDNIFNNKNDIISEINDFKLLNLELEYKIKDVETNIENLISEKNKLQYVVDNQLFNIDVYLEYSKNIQDYTNLSDKHIDETVKCKQLIESMTDEIDTIKNQYKNLINSIKPNMKDAYFSDNLFDPNIDYSEVDKVTMVDTSTSIRKNWLQEHTQSYKNLYEFKELYDELRNELNNHKAVFDKLNNQFESESDNLAELKQKIAMYNEKYDYEMEVNQNTLSELQAKVNDLNEKLTNGSKHYDFLLRKYDYQINKSKDHLQYLMKDYIKYDSEVTKFMDEVDAEFSKVTEEYLEYANKQNTQFMKTQTRFADSVNNTQIKSLLIKNYNLLRDHFGSNTNIEEIETIDDIVINNVTVDMSQNNSVMNSKL